jgi:hypothetical protein
MSPRTASRPIWIAAAAAVVAVVSAAVTLGAARREPPTPVIDATPVHRVVVTATRLPAQRPALAERADASPATGSRL